MRAGLPRDLLRVVSAFFVFLMLSPAAALADGPASVSALVKDLLPAVVNISTTQYIGANGLPYPEPPEGSPLGDLLEEVNPNSGQGQDALREARSLGSGFLVSPDGYLVTNNHVIEGADEILVYTHDNERYPATLVGSDDKTDIAVLKVDAGKPLPYVEFGDSDEAEIGDWLVVIGNPFGLGGSVSIGIVSARNRNINSGPYDDFIQTDAAINQGSSGGPVFDMNGKVVGIASALVAQGGNSLGIGFAIPTNMAKKVVSQLTEFGHTKRGWLGVGIQEVNEDVAAAVGLSKPEGALVVEVTPAGPAQDVLQEGDVILTYNGIPIEEVNDLPINVSQTPVGTDVTVEVLRDGEVGDMHITLGQLELGEKLISEARIAQASAPQPDAIPEDDGVRLSKEISDYAGFRVLPITADIRKGLSLQAHVSGLLLGYVDPKSDAAKKGMREGLVIARFDGSDLTSVGQLEDLIKAAREQKRSSVLVKVYDPIGIGRYLAIRLN